MAAVALLNLVAATQDIATDSLAVDLLPPAERGFANGLQVAGYRVGMILLLILALAAVQLCFPSAQAVESILELIFAPGFSTAETVTDVSGRGVGMDVVRRNVRSLGGEIVLSSKPGQGTRTLLRLPLTLAIVDGQLIRLGEHS